MRGILGASVYVRACMVSCEFWYACWAFEQLLSSLGKNGMEVSSSSWEIQHLCPSILSLLNFVQVEHVPPACRHVAHRLLIRLLRCAMVLQKSGRDGRNLSGFRDQFTKLEDYVPMLSEEMKALVEHDLRLSMKVLDGISVFQFSRPSLLSKK